MISVSSMIIHNYSNLQKKILILNRTITKLKTIDPIKPNPSYLQGLTRTSNFWFGCPPNSAFYFRYFLSHPSFNAFLCSVALK